MVTFKDTASIASSPQDILRVIILQRHTDLIESYESYEKIAPFSDPSTNIIRSRTIALFKQLRSMLKRTLKEEDFEDLKIISYSEKYEDLDQAYDIMTEVLDEKNIVKMDFMTKKKKTHRSEEADRLA